MYTIEQLTAMEGLINKVHTLLSFFNEDENFKSTLITELQKALDSEDIKVVKEALEKAIAALSDLKYGYKYPTPEEKKAEEPSDQKTNDFEEKIKALEAENANLKKEIEDYKLQILTAERVSKLNELNSDIDWQKYPTILKLSDTEFEEFLKMVANKESFSVPEQSSHRQKQSLADTAKEFFSKNS